MARSCAKVVWAPHLHAGCVGPHPCTRCVGPQLIPAVPNRRARTVGPRHKHSAVIRYLTGQRGGMELLCEYPWMC